MYVKNKMTKDPICIDISSKISEAVDLMSEHGLHRLPVVKGGKLAGLLTEGQIARKEPSKATSLSIYELNYLLSKTSVDAIMIRDVITIHEDRLLEDAALLMLRHDIGCLPVINDSNDKNVKLATANIKTLSIAEACDLNVYELVANKNIVITESAFKSLEEAYAE